jgi:hypothetical protein
MIEDILERKAQETVERIQVNIHASGQNKSGETADSVHYVMSDNKPGFTIFGGREFFPSIETGSKPSHKNPSPEMIKKMEKWKAISGAKGTPWGISKNILKFGSKLWQQGGRTDIYTDVVEELKKDLPEMIAKEAKKEYQISIHGSIRS